MTDETEVETEITQTEKPKEAKVTDADLNVLRETIKRKDAEKANLEAALSDERKRSQTSSSRLGEEIGNRFSAETVAVENSILAASSELDALEKQQSDLQEEGKFGEASKLNRLIAAAAVKLEKGEDQKRILESNKSRVIAEVEAQKRDPLAAYSAPARAWISSHPKFLSDNSYNAKVMAAHYQASANGITLDSKEYFDLLTEAVEPRITVEQPKPNVEDDVDENEKIVEQPKPARMAPKTSTAAPVSRGQNNSRPSSGGRIQLTPDEAEAAIISRPDLPKEEAYQRYFKNKQRAIADGKLGRTA